MSECWLACVSEKIRYRIKQLRRKKHVMAIDLCAQYDNWNWNQIRIRRTTHEQQFPLKFVCQTLVRCVRLFSRCCSFTAFHTLHSHWTLATERFNASVWLWNWIQEISIEYHGGQESRNIIYCLLSSSLSFRYGMVFECKGNQERKLIAICCKTHKWKKQQRRMRGVQQKKKIIAIALPRCAGLSHADSFTFLASCSRVHLLRQLRSGKNKLRFCLFFFCVRQCLLTVWVRDIDAQISLSQ